MYPKAKSLGIILKDEYVLLEQNYGKHSKGIGYYYRPIGGTIEFGEMSDDTLKREFLEEIDAEIVVEEYITCLENTFEIDKKLGHEIIQLYIASFKDENLYDKKQFKVTDVNKNTIAQWIPLSEIKNERTILFPIGLKELLVHSI
ncbi:NUDIX domain-containing protein [Filobacillus milosensis]|uniref:NUDIX domain-containing protein n=1 Tax=Filobacillus milosensis TaxID=94137 RepID=A0A4Y8ISH5_9BACI|nr:NUDIX domain-containing protein [Filobacillus milosensis]TFB23880.1 NUDIX domain-containing protein [Filobacillus milosensis]